jgi:hypothetical protein
MDQLKSGDWLNRMRVQRIALISALIGIAMLAFLLGTTRGTVDVYGHPIGSDFSVFWNAGDLANRGQAVSAWNPELLNAAAHRTHGTASVGDSAWLYPPVFLLVVSPLAMLPYTPALLVWQALSLAMIAWALSRILRTRRELWIALASPLTPLVLAHGQNAFLTAALVAGGLLALDRRQWLAGSLFGILVYKPQLALMIGPLLLFSRSWRAVAAAALVAAALIGLSIWFWGIASWQAFFASLPIGRHFMEQGSVGFHKSASLFAAARLWGAPVAVAYGLQALGLAFGLTLIWRLRSADSRVRAAGACAAIALSTPYLLDYELAIVGIGAAFLYAAAAGGRFLTYERCALAFIWIMPWFSRPAAEYLKLPLAPVAILLLAWLAWRRADLTASPSRRSHAVFAR